MNTLNLKGTWNEVAGRLKQEYAMLTDNDLLLVKGKEEELLGRLQIKLGQTKAEVQKSFLKFKCHFAKIYRILSACISVIMD